MDVLETPIFKKQRKKLPTSHKKILDTAIRSILEKLDIGVLKVGDLAGVRVHKFRMLSQEFLLAYEVDERVSQLILLALGSHENFYRDLKKRI